MSEGGRRGDVSLSAFVVVPAEMPCEVSNNNNKKNFVAIDITYLLTCEARNTSRLGAQGVSESLWQ